MTDKPSVTETGIPPTTRCTLTQAKETRKRAELDAQLLANRIALLKQEEEKAERKITDTKKRAHEILNLRHQNEDKFQQKELHYKDKWESIRQSQTENSYKRDQVRNQKEQKFNRLQEGKKECVYQIKMQKSDHLLAKKERETNERIVNCDRSNHIRQQKENAKHRMEMERLARLDKYRRDYEERVSREEELRQRTELLVTKMEKEEMELIQRLQNTQAMQRQAYEDLENALNGSQIARPPISTHESHDRLLKDKSVPISRPAA